MALVFTIRSGEKTCVASGSIILRAAFPVTITIAAEDEHLKLDLLFENWKEDKLQQLKFEAVDALSARATFIIAPDSLVPIIFDESTLGSIGNQSLTADFAIERYHQSAILTYAFYLGGPVDG